MKETKYLAYQFKKSIETVCIWMKEQWKQDRYWEKYRAYESINFKMILERKYSLSTTLYRAYFIRREDIGIEMNGQT